jgi:hypothetical protein
MNSARFDQLYLNKSEQLNEELIVQYPAYLEKIKKIKHFQLIHQPSYPMLLDDYISIEFFQQMYKSENRNEYLELFKMLAELSEFIPQDKNTLLHGPLHTIFKNALNLANSLTRQKVNDKNVLITLNSSIAKTLEFIKDPIPAKASELIAAADSMAKTIVRDETLPHKFQIAGRFLLIGLTVIVAVTGNYLTLGIATVSGSTTVALLLKIYEVIISFAGLALIIDITADKDFPIDVYSVWNLKNAQHKISGILTNPLIISDLNPILPAASSAINELITTKKMQAQEIANDEKQKLRDYYESLEKNIKLLKEFQIKHYPTSTNLTGYLASVAAFKTMFNNTKQNKNTRREIMTLLNSLGELSQSVEQANIMIQPSLCVALFNAIKLSENIIKDMQADSTDKIKVLSNVIQKANAFALDHDNRSHRSELIYATNAMIDDFIESTPIYPENRSLAFKIAAIGCGAGIAMALTSFVVIGLTSSALMTPSLLTLGIFIGSSFTALINTIILKKICEIRDTPNETLTYNIGRQLDLISKPFLFFSRRQNPSAVEENNDDRILLSSFVQPFRIS